MPGPVVRPGDAVRLLFPHSNPPKRKICICVCIREGLFLVVNSRPYGRAPADSQLKVFKEELACLEYDSFLDASKTYRFETAAIREAAKGGVFRLAASALERIKSRIEGQGYLPREHKGLILANL